MSVYREEWREVFIIAAEIFVFGAIVYLILGKGERQWWAGGGVSQEGIMKKGRTKEDLDSNVLHTPNSLSVTVKQKESICRNIQNS